MSNLRNILNPAADDGESSSMYHRFHMDVDSPPRLPEPPSSPGSVTSATVDAVEEVEHPAAILYDPKDHAPHPNCPDTLDCLPDTEGRPQHTLPVILRCAILGSPRKRLTIREIYAAMENKYAYYKTAGSTWKQSVRHHLSLNRLFERQARPVTDPGFGSYWTVNLAAPPGTKRPRKRGRGKNNNADGEGKRRGRPRKEDLPPTPQTPSSATTLPSAGPSKTVQDTEMTHFDIDGGGGHGSLDEDYESDEETMQHPFERRTSLVRMQLSAYTPSSSSSSALPSFPGEDDSANVIERLDIEVSTLRRQAADAVQVSMRLTDQLSQAQAEASRAKSNSKRLETLLAEETMKLKMANLNAREETERRRLAENEIRALQQQLVAGTLSTG
ncbi:hypothetical protein C8J56DRAFT_919999 [Mycena floridula]|nr:hypothetical protein C8J56DRAFT_919999 [Mycena floridula]